MPLDNGPLIGGHYDANGQWVQTKFCFFSCGDRCDCMPPDGVFQLPRPTIEVSLPEDSSNE